MSGVSDRTSAGHHPVAAEAEPPAALDTTGFLARGRIRRRAKYLRQLRELQLRDLGGFLLELHRFGRERPDLVNQKLLDAARTDAEMRALTHALEIDPAAELRLAGIGGACANCGAVHGSEDRYCAACGEPVSDRSSKR